MDKIVRAIDANLNRSREGLRVVEDLVRFVLDDAEIAPRIKALRHDITVLAKQLRISELELLGARDSKGDVGAELPCADETSRSSLSQIASANMRRAQEAMRVLEELSKLYDANTSLQFKRLRFQLYDLEKQILPKLVECKHNGQC